MDHDQFVKEYRDGRGLSATEVLVFLGLGFALWHLLRATDRSQPVTGYSPPKEKASPKRG
jgi:hypothetical protein